MAHIVSGSVEFGSNGGVTMKDCVVIGTGRGYAMDFRVDAGHIGSFSVRYAAKPLHERFADFKARLRAAMDRHGL